MVKKWNVIHDADTETGDPTCWSLEINSHKYGRFIFITIDYNDFYNVEVDRDGEFKVLKSLKSLNGAKRWVRENILQEERQQ